MRLREYQTEAVDRVEDAFGQGKSSALIVLPTGTGKTVVFCELIKRMHARGRTSLVIVHERELMDQAAASIRRMIPDVPIQYEQGMNRAQRVWHGPRVIIATIQSLASGSEDRGYRREEFDETEIEIVPNGPVAGTAPRSDYAVAPGRT